MTNSVFKILNLRYVLVTLAVFIALNAFAGRDEDFRFANKLFSDGYYDLSAEQFLKFVENYPDDQRVSSAYYMRGKSLFALENWHEARQSFLRVALEFNESRNASESLFQAAICLQKSGKSADAARNFMSVGDYYPNSEYAGRGLLEAGIVYLQLEERSKAKSAFKRIVNEYRNTELSAQAHYHLGEIEFAQNALADAMQSYLLTTETTRDHTLSSKAKIQRANIFYSRGQWNKAEKELETIKSPLPYFDYARLMLAVWKQKQGRLTEAGKQFVNLIENSSQDTIIVKSKIYLADNFYLVSDFTRAVELYRSISENDSLNLRLGLTCQRIDSCDLAVQYFSKVLDGEGDLSEKSIALDGLKILYGKTKIRTNISDILRKYLSELESIPHWESFAISMGIIALSDDDLDLALQFFQKLENSRSLYPDDALYYRAIIAQKLRDYKLSNSLLLQLQSDYPGSDFAVSADSLRHVVEELIPPDNLVDEVADISASAMAYRSKGEVSLHWGKGYFASFKDYAKACDYLRSALRSGDLDRNQAGETLAFLALALDKRREEGQTIADSVKTVMQSYLRGHPQSYYAGTFTLYLLKSQIASDNSLAITRYYDALEEILEKYQKDIIIPEVLKELISSSSKITQYAEKAPEYYQRLTTNFPHSEFIEGSAISVMNALLLLDRQEEARSQALRYIQESPSGTNIFTAKITAAKLNPDLPERISRFEEIYRNYYYNINILKLNGYLGDLYLQSGDYQKALDSYSKLENIQAVYSDLVFVLDADYKIGIVYKKLGNLPKAHDYLLRYAVNNTGGKFWEQAVFTLAEISEMEDRPPVALQFYENILSHSSDPAVSDSARVKMAAVYYKIDRFNDGRILYLQLAETAQNPVDRMEYTAKAIVGLYRQGLLENAREEAVRFAANYKKSPELGEFQAVFYLEKGRGQAKEKNFSQAIKTLQTVGKKYKATKAVPDAEYEIGRILLITNHYDEALKVLTNLPQKYPGHVILPSVYNTLGAFYYRQQQYQNALIAFQKVIEDTTAREMWPSALKNLEVTYKDLGLWEAAYSIVNRYIELYPYSDDVLAKKLDSAQLLIRMREYERAIEKLMELLPKVSEDMRIEVQFYLGDAHFQAENYQQAALEYMKVKYLDQGGGLDWAVTSLYNAGKCYEKLGKPEEAKNLYEEIISHWGADSEYGRGAQQRIDFLKQLKD